MLQPQLDAPARPARGSAVDARVSGARYVLESSRRGMWISCRCCVSRTTQGKKRAARRRSSAGRRPTVTAANRTRPCQAQASIVLHATEREAGEARAGPDGSAQGEIQRWTSVPSRRTQIRRSVRTKTSGAGQRPLVISLGFARAAARKTAALRSASGKQDTEIDPEFGRRRSALRSLKRGSSEPSRRRPGEYARPTRPLR